MNDKMLKEKLFEISEMLTSANSGFEVEPCEHLDGLSSVTSSMEMQDIVDHLRLQAKYLLFELEASGRERKFLLRMLEKSSGT